MNARIAAYAPMCQSLAERYAAGRRARQVGAECADLYQEGLISVWQALERGVRPSAELIEFRMRDYMRWLGRQTPVDYETLLPIDDFRLAG